jgi:cellulose synthase/poly-beta-1,6-N-acetylglucosamine synthase-like glycosyltransferase
VATFIEYMLPNASVPRGVAPVPFLVGGNSFFRSEAVRSVLPIPEPLAGEDAVISLRVRDSGWRLLFDPSLVVWHEMHYSTLGELFRHKYLMGRGAQQCWRTDNRLIHWQSPVKAYALPVLVISAIITLLVDRFLSVLVAGVGLIILSFLSVLCWRRTRSIRGAILFPVVLAVMSSGHSAGFLRETALSLTHGDGEPDAT